MRPGSFVISAQRGATLRLTFTPRNADGVAWDLTGRTARFVAYGKLGEVLELDGSVGANGSCQITSGVIRLHVTAAGTELLGVAALDVAQAPLAYQLDLTTGDVDRILVGELEVSRGVA